MTTDDWLYLRAYGGPARHSLEIDPVLRTTAAWIGDLAPARWHFLRYVDVDGQHLRVRLRGPADAVDRWYAALPRLDAALAGCRPRERDRLLDDPLVTTVGSRRGTSLGVYSPEVHKYGTGSALDAAEDHFDASSRWCVDHGVWRWSAATRVAAAVHYLVGLADGLDATGADRGHQLLDRHRTHWGPRLRLAGVDTRRAREAQRLVRAADLAARRERPLEGPVAELVASHLDTGLATGPDPLRSFHLAHMDLNRIGVNPVEECLAGLVARALRDQQGPRTDHATVVRTGEEA